MDHTTNPSLADMASSLQTASCGYIHHDATLEGSQTVTWTPHSIFTAHFPSTLTRAKWPDFAELPKSRSSIYKLGRHQNDSRCGTWGRVLREPDRIDRQNGKKHVFFASIRRASETTSPKAPAASFPPETINWKLLRSEAEAAPRMTEKPEPMMRRSAFCSLPTFCPNWLEWRVKENPAYPTSPHVKKKNIKIALCHPSAHTKTDQETLHRPCGPSRQPGYHLDSKVWCWHVFLLPQSKLSSTHPKIHPLVWGNQLNSVSSPAKTSCPKKKAKTTGKSPNTSCRNLR